jgi:hypothetical protein
VVWEASEAQVDTDDSPGGAKYLLEDGNRGRGISVMLSTIITSSSKSTSIDTSVVS